MTVSRLLMFHSGFRNQTDDGMYTPSVKVVSENRHC